MTPLGRRIAAEIAAAGPISVGDYMMRCLHDGEAGYYATREPFGREGDFITAPEVSQMFGELVAVWLYRAWLAQGRPQALLAEVGPGRGTLFADIVRTWKKLDPTASTRLRPILIETSARLRKVQADTLASKGISAQWLERIDDLPAEPLFIVGNEIFDALPLRQFVMTTAGWRERLVDVDADGHLRFVVGPGAMPQTDVPPGLRSAPDGSILEIAPARSAMAAAIAERIAASGGAALYVDYGHLEPGLGDTLQAVRRHETEGVFDNPGEADLTSHVDFAALGAVARSAGLVAAAETQGEFLLAMGLIERAGRLGAEADERTRERLRGEVERLAGPDQMGSLFKAMAWLPRGVGGPPFRFG